MKRELIIDGIVVDVSAILSLAHECDPGNCDVSESCCSTYEVPLERDEADRVIGLLPDAGRYAPALKQKKEYADPVDEGEFGLCDADDSGGGRWRCPLRRLVRHQRRHVARDGCRNDGARSVGARESRRRSRRPLSQRLRSGGGEQSGGTTQGVDAEARFQQFFDNKFAGEIKHRERVDQVGSKTAGLFGSIGNIERGL